MILLHSRELGHVCLYTSSLADRQRCFRPTSPVPDA